MKKLQIALVVVVIAAAGIYALRGPLMNVVVERVTADMFVAQDADAYDPGVAVGEQMPSLHARFDGREVTQLGEMTGAKGTVLFVNRSVDW
jgi:hypothetical protein